MVGRNEKGAAWIWRRLTWGTACAAGLAVAGYTGSQFLALRRRPPPKRLRADADAGLAPTASPSDYGQRPVAFPARQRSDHARTTRRVSDRPLRRREAAAAHQQNHH